MNQVTIIAYQPGSFGSFVSWMVERFSTIRRMHQPPVIDDPVMPNGSSHGYASFCKIKSWPDFKQALNDARWDVKSWHHVLYAGWPAGTDESLRDVLADMVDWMMPFDRTILIDCLTDDDHLVRYLRNERQMDRDRWYGMMGIDHDDQLYDRMLHDIHNSDTSLIRDPRVLHLPMDDIVRRDPGQLYDQIMQFLGWPVCDRDLFIETAARQRLLNQPYMVDARNIGSANTPAESAVLRYITEKRKP